MENSNGLFQLTCVCDNVYAPELGKCPSCGKGTMHQKKLELDYQKFFDKMIALQEAGKKSGAMDVLMDVFWQLWSRYDIMDKILTDLPLDKVHNSIMIGCMSNTFKYKPQLPNFVDFCNRSFDVMRSRGKDEKELETYRIQFRDVDVKKHWENMKAFGVQFPNALFGPGPEGDDDEEDVQSDSN